MARAILPNSPSGRDGGATTSIGSDQFIAHSNVADARAVDEDSI
jgi:hypothetical protein